MSKTTQAGKNKICQGNLGFLSEKNFSKKDYICVLYLMAAHIRTHSAQMLKEGQLCNLWSHTHTARELRM